MADQVPTVRTGHCPSSIAAGQSDQDGDSQPCRHSLPGSPVPPRRFDPALSLSAIAAVAVVVTSLALHGELVARDRRDRGDATAALAELVAARLDGNLQSVLSSLETAAASPPAGLDQGTATLRAQGVVTAVTRVGVDGLAPAVVAGDAATVGVLPASAFDRARDSGAARLERGAGRPGLVAVAPLYEGVPRGTAERRTMLDGYVLAALDVPRLVGQSLPPDSAASLRLTDGADVVATLGEPGGRGSQAQQPVEAGGAVYRLTVTGPAGSTRFPALPLSAAVLAVGILGPGIAGVRARRRAEDAASVRGEELGLLADLGALLQESLDLKLILPAAALRLSEQLQLDGVGVLRADRRGRLVHAFLLGTAPAGMPGTVADIGPAPLTAAAGADALLPPQRGGRVTGA